jgi:hypothetical protein
MPATLSGDEIGSEALPLSVLGTGESPRPGSVAGMGTGFQLDLGSVRLSFRESGPKAWSGHDTWVQSFN